MTDRLPAAPGFGGKTIERGALAIAADLANTHASFDPRAFHSHPDHGEYLLEIFSQAFAAEKATKEDLYAETLLVAWRLTREMGRHFNQVAEGEPLEEALVPSLNNPDPWYRPNPEVFAPNGIMLGSRHANMLAATGNIDLLARISRTVQQQTYIPKSGPQRGVELVLRPISLDPEAPDSGSIRGIPLQPPKNRNADDGLMNLWIDTMHGFADHLGITTANWRSVCKGSLVLRLLDHQPHQWPSPMELLTFESSIVESVLHSMREARGTTEVSRQVRLSLGLTRHETKSVLSLARRAAVTANSYDTEEARAMMVLRLEDLASRAREALDVRGELAVLKQLSTVQGLSAVESSDVESDFIHAVKHVANTAGQKRLEE